MDKDFAKTALSVCNTWGKITSGIFIIILIIALVFLVKDDKSHALTTGKVKSVNKDGCVSRERVVNTSRRSRIELYSDCYLTIEYSVNGKKIVHDLHTEDVEHRKGETIKIQYNVNNPKMIRVYNEMYHYAKWICLVLLIFISITLYLRIYHFDNKYVKTFIGISCIQDTFSNSYF
jgi:hypothetical protein